MTRTTCATDGLSALHRWQVAIFYGRGERGRKSGVEWKGDQFPQRSAEQAQTVGLMRCGSQNMCASHAILALTIPQSALTFDIFETGFATDRPKCEANCGCKCSHHSTPYHTIPFPEMINWKLINYVKLWRGKKESAHPHRHPLSGPSYFILPADDVVCGGQSVSTSSSLLILSVEWKQSWHLLTFLRPLFNCPPAIKYDHFFLGYLLKSLARR